MKTMGIKKINFGCGTTRIERWINVDKDLRHRLLLTRIPGFFHLLSLLRTVGLLLEDEYKAYKRSRFVPIRYGDVRKKLRFKDNSVDYIYNSHLLEHLFPDEGLHFLKECYRILKPGGLIRIVIPDLEGIARRYINGINNSGGSVESTEEFVQVFCQKFSRKVPRILRYYKVIRGHHWLYDRISLSNYLTEIGYSSVRVCEFRKGKCSDIDISDSKPNSLFMEAMKGAYENHESPHKTKAK